VEALVWLLGRGTVPDTFGITVDCQADELDSLADFWAAVLGYNKVFPLLLVDPKGVKPRIAFQVVPEPKQVKNRWHLDVYVDDLASLEPRVRALVELGATEVRHVDETVLGYSNIFTAMLDPHGNEFCVCAPHLPRSGRGKS
jgi:hypothetical protein